MIGTIVLLGYIVAGIITSLAVGRLVLRSDFLCIDVPDPSDYAICAFLGLLAGLIWPAALVVGAFAMVLRRDSEKNDPRVRKALLDEREQRIRDLERELGINR